MIRRRRVVTAQNYRQDARQAVKLPTFRKNLRDTVKMCWQLVTEGEDVGLGVCIFRLYICMYVCMYVCMCVCVCVCVCVSVCFVLFGRIVEGGDSGRIGYSPKIWLQGLSRNTSKVS